MRVGERGAAAGRQVVRRKRIAQTSSPKSSITPYGIERYNLEGVCANSGYNGKNYTNSPPSGPGMLSAFRLRIRSQVLALADLGDVDASEIATFL